MEGRFAITIDGCKVEMTTAAASDYLRGLNNREDEFENSRLKARMKTGAALLEMRPQYRYGSWAEFLKASDVDPRRATSAMQLASKLAGPDGQADLQKCIAAGLAQREGHNRRSGADLLKGVSLRQAEVATGIRKATGREDDGAEDDQDAVQIDPAKASAMLAGLVPVGGRRDQGGAKVETLEVDGRGIVVTAGATTETRSDDRGVAGRIGRAGSPPPPFENLPAARRADVAGQMTLVGSFLDGINSRKERLERLDGDRRLAAEAVLAECGRKLDEILEAA